MKKKVIVLFVFFLAQIASAQEEKRTPPNIRGYPNCAEWLKPNGSLKELANKYWLTGYLSGINLGLFLDERRKPVDYYSSASPDQIFLWMDNYCRANPLSNVFEGDANLFSELDKK